MSDIVIKAEGIGKSYLIGHKSNERYVALRDVIVNKTKGLWSRIRSPRSHTHRDIEEFWALKDISFEVKQGERIGIIGRNGAGKSTLLKILSRITEPTTGRVSIKGRVASLLEVGTGFHPELTGRENIYLNGAILGMTRREIKSKFDEIITFAEVEKFLDTPVKRFSSGMYVRLAFAVAAHLDPEILVVDEVLAVGDAFFQKKCLGRMGEVAREGRTVLFVSHNMGAICELCSSAILINDGKKVMHGPVAEVIEYYSRISSKSESSFKLSDDPSLPCSITGLKLSNSDGIETTTFNLNDEIILTITYRIKTRIEGFHIVITLSRYMVDILHSYDVDGMDEIPPRGPGLYETQLRIPRMFLKGGSYSITVITTDPVREYQWLNSALSFEIEETSQNTYRKGYRRDRLGYVISSGVWQTIKLG